MRIFVDKIDGNKCILTGDAHHHIAYAVRSRVGDLVTLCPQDGFDYNGVIESISKDSTVVNITEKRPSAGEPDIKLTVFFGVPNKGEKLDLIAQKLTELGATAVQPVMTEYVQARSQSVRVDRLSRICEEAAKQCGRGMIPKVFAPITFADMLPLLSDFDLVIFPYERETQLSLKEFMRNRSAPRPRKAAVIIGSEGGFSETEAKALKSRNIESVTLGSRILRTETANIAVVSALMYELGEWSVTGKGGEIQ